MSRRRRQAAALLLISAATFVVSVMMSVVVVDDVLHNHTPTPTPQVVLSVKIECTPLVPVAVGTLMTCQMTEDIPDIFAWHAPEGSPTIGVARMFETTFSAPGDKTVTLDFCTGDDCQTAELSVIVLGPPLVSLSCTPSPALVGQTVSCIASVLEGQPNSVVWDASGTPEPTNELKFDRPFSELGVKTITVTACSAVAGCDTDVAAVQVVETPPVVPPQVALECAQTALVGGAVSCRVSFLEGSADSFLWDTSSTDAVLTSEPTYDTSFPEPGIHEVTVEVAISPAAIPRMLSSTSRT